MKTKAWREWYAGTYLQSEHWRQLHEEAAERYGDRCTRCDRSGEEMNLHHRHYQHLGQEKLGADVIWICRDCHSFLHGRNPIDPAHEEPTCVGCGGHPDVTTEYDEPICWKCLDWRRLVG